MDADLLKHIQNMVDGAKGAIDFVKNEANSNNFTPEQKAQLEQQLKVTGFYTHEKALNDILEGFKQHYGPNTAKQ